MPFTKFTIACVPVLISCGSCAVMLCTNWVNMSIPASMTCGTRVKSPSTKTVITSDAAVANAPELSVIPLMKFSKRSTPMLTT